MPFTEDDIDFSKLTGRKFEELCLDLLNRVGFHSLGWRQGGADQGRDIEALSSANNPLLGVWGESWFFECKNLSGGVSVNDLAEKIVWADAERPEHFVIVTSTYVTTNAIAWLRAIRKSKSYQIHTVDGKRLKKVIMSFPELMERYFFDHFRLLLQDSVRRWVISGVLPGPKEQHVFSQNLSADKLDFQSVAFLFICQKVTRDEDADWCEENNVKNVGIAGLSDRLLCEAGRAELPLLAEFESVHAHETQSRLMGSCRYKVEDGRLVGSGKGEVAEASLKHIEDEILMAGLSYEVTARLILRKGERVYSALYCYSFLPQPSVFLEVLVFWDGQLRAKARSVEQSSDFVKDQLRAVGYLSSRG